MAQINYGLTTTPVLAAVGDFDSAPVAVLTTATTVRSDTYNAQGVSIVRFNYEVEILELDNTTAAAVTVTLSLGVADQGGSFTFSAFGKQTVPANGSITATMSMSFDPPIPSLGALELQATGSATGVNATSARSKMVAYIAGQI